MTTHTLVSPLCVGCRKYAGELEEYIGMGKIEEMTPDEFVRSEEGTYNPQSGHFLCTKCYIEAGMPSSRHGWCAP